MIDEIQVDDNKYLCSLIEKYNFIDSIYITDAEGYLMLKANKSQAESNEDKEKTKIAVLSYYFSLGLEHFSMTKICKTKGITMFFDNHIIYQYKLNKISFCHFICNTKDYSHIILRDICEQLKVNLSHLEKEFLKKVK